MLKRLRAFKKRNVCRGGWEEIWEGGGRVGCALVPLTGVIALGWDYLALFVAGFSVPKNPRSSVRTSGPKLTVTDNFKWPFVDRQTGTVKFHDFALLCIFFLNVTVVNDWWVYTRLFTLPFDVLIDLVVFGANFQVADVDKGLFPCRLFAGGESPELIILISVRNCRGFSHHKFEIFSGGGPLDPRFHLWRPPISFNFEHCESSSSASSVLH